MNSSMHGLAADPPFDKLRVTGAFRHAERRQRYFVMLSLSKHGLIET